MDLTYARPKRKDGSEHFVCAGIYSNNDVVKTISDKGFAEFVKYSYPNSIKTRESSTIVSLQFDLSEFGDWRDFRAEDLEQLKRISEIIKNGEMPNEYDKELIATQCKKGYVKVENGKPVLLVPFVRKAAGSARLRMQCSDSSIFDNFNIEELADLLVAHKTEVAKMLPKQMDKNERNYILGAQCGFGAHNIIYMLHKNGYLYNPSKDEQKRICTLLLEK